MWLQRARLFLFAFRRDERLLLSLRVLWRPILCALALEAVSPSF